MESQKLEKSKKSKKQKENIIIPPKAHIKVFWDDFPENNSYEGKKRIKVYFSNKYKIPEENINVVFRAKKRDKDGNEVNIEEGVIDNIMDITYQRELFKQWVEREKIVVGWDRLLKLDDKVNEILKSRKDTDYRYRRWYINKIEIDNFLSFGEGNVIDYNKLKGINLVTSNPSNTGGKTTFSVDAILFLFFGVTTKTSKNEEIFNTFTDKNRVSVKGYINIDGQDYIIERTLNRKETKKGGWSVTSTLEYYKILSDGSFEDLKGEARQATEKFIIETIGSDSDFLTTIIATAENIESLIDSKPTERGKIFTKFIGLEVIEEKESIVKELSSDFRKKMKSNVYDSETLQNEIQNNYKNIEEQKNLITKSNEDLLTITDEINNIQFKKDELVSKKQEVDPKILKLNVVTIENEITAITNKGKSIRSEIETLRNKLETIGDVEFNEEEYDEKLSEEKNYLIKKNTTSTEINGKNKLIKQFEEGKVCPTCKRDLDDGDHTDEINSLKDELEILNNELVESTELLTSIQSEIKLLKDIKNKVDEIERTKLLISKKEVEIDKLRIELTDKNDLLEDYHNNESLIENNNKLQSEIIVIEGTLAMKNRDRDKCLVSIENCKNQIIRSETLIQEKGEIIEEIKQEEEIDRIFTVYEKMIGKNGISKLVIKSVVPILNSEIGQLLDGICDFDVEINISDKNEIEFLIIRGDVVKNLSTGSGFEKTIGSLAFRTILGRISTLPKPNIIVFDEVLGKVSDENLHSLSSFFDKIRGYFDVILLITHREHFKDLANQQIMINKENNISKFLLI